MNFTVLYCTLFTLFYSTKITCWLATEYDKKETFTFLLKILKLSSLNKEIRSRIFVTTPMTSMPNRIVLAAMALLSQEPKLIEDILSFLENFYENYFGELKNFESIDKISTDSIVSKKIMKFATNLDDPLVKDIIKEDFEFFSVYNNLDFDQSIFLSLNGNSFNIPIKNEEISDKLDELISIELRERGERLFQLAEEDQGDVGNSVLSFSFIERKLLVSINENLSNLLSISTYEFPKILK